MNCIGTRCQMTSVATQTEPITVGAAVPSLPIVPEETPTGPVTDTEEATPSPTKKKSKRPPTAWQKHVAAFRLANPGLSFKDCLKGAKETYVRAK
jgi:hypothetical protein